MVVVLYFLFIGLMGLSGFGLANWLVVLLRWVFRWGKCGCLTVHLLFGLSFGIAGSWVLS